LRLSEDPAPGQLTPAFLLAEQYVPIAFPGDLALVSDIPLGPVMCLNIMTRRGVMRAQVRIINESTMLQDTALQMLLATDTGWQVNGQILDRYDSMSGFTEASLSIEAPPDLRGPLVAVSILKAHAN
jgi:environmental stress-induced protein Ves